MKLPVAPEREVLRLTLEWLKLHGVLAWRVNTSGLRRRDKAGLDFFTRAPLVGVSDVIGVLGPRTARPGVLLALEAKRPGGKLSPQQALFLEAVRSNGGIALVVTGVDDLERELKPLLRG